MFFIIKNNGALLAQDPVVGVVRPALIAAGRLSAYETQVALSAFCDPTLCH